MSGPGYTDRPRYLHVTDVDPRRYDLDPRPTMRNARHNNGRGWTRAGLAHHQAKSQRLIGFLRAWGLDERDRVFQHHLDEERRRHENALRALEDLRDAFLHGRPMSAEATTDAIRLPHSKRKAG